MDVVVLSPGWVLVTSSKVAPARHRIDVWAPIRGLGPEFRASAGVGASSDGFRVDASARAPRARDPVLARRLSNGSRGTGII